MKSKIKSNEYLPALLNLAAAIIVFLLSFFTDLRFGMPEQSAKILGISIVFSGMGLVIWAAVHLKGAFLGEVAPRLEVLVQDGPYRFIRHPVYLGMTIALAGVPVALRSWLGLMGVLVLFLPSEIIRARLEEEALREKFGKEWEHYAAHTGFFIPLIARD
jgi:protein-S-isoprenylcysteine O-methyltransferase Ste14